MHMLHDLTKDDGYIAVKGAAGDRDGWRHREGCQNPALQQKMATMITLSNTKLDKTVQHKIRYLLRHFSLTNKQFNILIKNTGTN